MPLLLPSSIATDRLELRRPLPDQADLVAAAVAETLPSLAKWFRWGKLLARYGDLEDMGARAVSGHTRFDELDNPVFFIWSEGRFVGEILIENPHWESSRALELQIWIRTSAQGHGFATEAGRAIVDHLFGVQGCHFLEARIGSSNAPSRRLFLRLGFRAFGVRDDHSRYLLTADDWDGEVRELGVVVLTHPECLGHVVGPGHPESPRRLETVLGALADLDVVVLGAPRDRGAVGLAHDPAYLDALDVVEPATGLVRLDANTTIGPNSVGAALRGVGGVVSAVDLVVDGRCSSAFVATRPPGHHAEFGRAMGYCLFSTAAIGALHATRRRGVQRVAVVDFDVHHGNGTQRALQDQPGLLFVSTHEAHLFPNTGSPRPASDNVLNIVLPHRTDGPAYRQLFEAQVLPRLVRFDPQLILVSAGFDAHRADDSSTIRLEAEDYEWVTRELRACAPIVSILEGGYDLPALGASSRAHVAGLLGRRSR